MHKRIMRAKKEVKLIWSSTEARTGIEKLRIGYKPLYGNQEKLPLALARFYGSARSSCCDHFRLAGAEMLPTSQRTG